LQSKQKSNTFSRQQTNQSNQQQTTTNMSNKKIERLTEEQKAKMPEYVTKWINIGINTDRLDYDETLDIVNNVQVHLLNRKATPVVIFDNPMEAWVACNYAHIHGVRPNDLHSKVDEFFSGKKIELEPFVMPHLTGSFDASVFSFYDFFRNEVEIDFKEYTEKYDIWQSTSKLGLIYPLDEVAIVSQKPTLIKFNENRVAHCDGGPAISYAGKGDFHLYMLNGVRVPEWLAVTHSSKIDIKKYKEISNADVKMEFVRKVGIERMLHLGKKIDSYENYKNSWWTQCQYELWDMNVLFAGAVPYAPHVKMLNQTTGVWHVEAVSPECKNLKEALHERFGGEFEIQAVA
jgi:hypothetical protein